MLHSPPHNRWFLDNCNPATLRRFAVSATLIGVAYLAIPSTSDAQQATASQQAEPTKPDQQFGPVESVDSLTRSMWLIQGTVHDALTGKPIPQVTMIPGSLSRDQSGKTVVRWRENLKRNMRDQLKWPRTSGYSVMRFKLIAEGYQPIITQRVYRGGPHIRLRVKMHPAVASDAVK